MPLGGDVVNWLLYPGVLDELLLMFEDKVNYREIARHFDINQSDVFRARKAYREGKLQERVDACLSDTVNTIVKDCQVLLAKSCIDCGLFLPESWYYTRKQTKGARAGWHSRCKVCHSARCEDNRKKRGKPSKARRNVPGALQNMTDKHAVNAGKPWTDEDIRILDGEGTIYAKAIRLGRTYNAVSSKMWALSTEPRAKKLPADLEDQQWVIYFRDAV